MAIHIPWDRVEDYAKLAKHADDHGWRWGINPNVFQDNDYMLGSVSNPDPGCAARRPTICSSAWTSGGDRVEGSQAVVLRRHQLPGPGQHPRPARTGWPRRWRRPTRPGDEQRMLLEYKLFEPAFYTMDIPDWGTAYLTACASASGPQVVVDTGHHAPGTNIEFIVAVAAARRASSAASTSTPASTPTTT